MRSSTVETGPPLATTVEVTDDTLSVELADGRTILAPLAWYPRLAHATAEERNSWRLLGAGQGIHWPDIDEDVSVANLLMGQPSGESQRSFKKWLADRRKATRPERGHVSADLESKRRRGRTTAGVALLPKANVEPQRHVREFRLDAVGELAVGKVLTVQEVFDKVTAVDVIGTSKGRG